MNLQEKRVVLTGASSGIGLELLLKLLDKGCKVVATSRNITTKCNITNDNLYLLDCDVSSKDGVDRLFEYALSKLNDIDLFVANAGFAYYGNNDNPDWERIDKIFSTNVYSVFYAAEKMKELKGEMPYNFLVTASGMSFISIPGYTYYAATKAALRGYADSYRYELGRGQHLQLVYPIATRTNFFQAAGDIPMAWPSQSSELVVRKIIKGIERDKLDIYPSKQFVFFKAISGIFPFLVSLYNIPMRRKFISWLKSKDND